MRSAPARWKFHKMGSCRKRPSDLAGRLPMGSAATAAEDAPESPSRKTWHEPASDAAVRDDPTGKPQKENGPRRCSLGEHTSLGPKSYCPDYRTLPVTEPDLGVSSRTT